MGRYASEVLLAKVRLRYLLSLGQVSEILRIPRGTLCSVAAGTRVLPKAKQVQLQRLLDLPMEESDASKTDHLLFPGYVTATLKSELDKLLPKREKMAAQIQLMEEAFGQTVRAREMYSKLCDVIEQTDLPISVWRSFKRYSLVKDVRLDKVDLHRIVLLQAKLAGLDAQIQVLQLALANNRL